MDFGSLVSSMTPLSVSASSLSISRTRICAARSIAREPSSTFAMVPHYGTKEGLDVNRKGVLSAVARAMVPYPGTA